MALLNDDIRQSGLHPQIRVRKFPRIADPCSVCVTSGWNWMPWIGRRTWRIAAAAHVAVLAITSNSCFGSSTRSPWLIHTT